MYYFFVAETDNDKNTSSGPCNESYESAEAGFDREFPTVSLCDKSQSQFRCVSPLTPISRKLIKAT